MSTANVYQSEVLERVTGSYKTIDSEHAQIHDGELYESFNKFTLASGSNTIFAITTPSAKYIHWRPTRLVTTADSVTLDAFETQTFTGGTTLSRNNHRRLTTTNSGLVINAGVTATPSGTAFAQSFLGGGVGNGQSRSGADASSSNEWVLKQDTTYLIRITNGSTTSNTIQVNFNWYEEENA